MTEASQRALTGLRDPHTLQWYAIPLLAITFYIYATEIKKARASVKLSELMGNLGGTANDVMEEYSQNFAGKARKGRDVDLISKLCDQLGEISSQMSDLGRAEVVVDVGLAAILDGRGLAALRNRLVGETVGQL